MIIRFDDTNLHMFYRRTIGFELKEKKQKFPHLNPVALQADQFFERFFVSNFNILKAIFRLGLEELINWSPETK